MKLRSLLLNLKQVLLLFTCFACCQGFCIPTFNLLSSVNPEASPFAFFKFKPEDSPFTFSTYHQAFCFPTSHLHSSVKPEASPFTFFTYRQAFCFPIFYLLSSFNFVSSWTLTLSAKTVPYEASLLSALLGYQLNATVRRHPCIAPAEKLDFLIRFCGSKLHKHWVKGG